MLHRLTVSLAPVLVTLALVGCGGGGGGGGDEASFDAGPAEIAKPGSKRPLGERAFVEYSGLGADAADIEVKTTLGVTVREVNEGESGDIDGLGEGSVPYYVHVEYENHGDGEIDVGGAGVHFTIRGTDGEEYDRESVISIGGEFEQCPKAETGSTIKGEQAANDCVVITLTKGAKPQEVRFKADLFAEAEPVAWTVG